jgi:asparagine synthase (glutamine-hydrolysing)
VSGIVGLYNLDGRPAEQTDIQRMVDSIAHRGPDGSGVWTNGSVGLGCQLLRVTPESTKETQPSVHHSGNVAVFDGRLDNREELLLKLKASNEISAESPDPDLVLAAYHEFGDKFVERLIGDFALGLFDLNRQKFLLARDTMGVRPLYYYYTPKLFLFASEIKALLAHPQVSTRPNDDYLAEFLFLRLSGNDGEGSTFFKGVNNLPPGYLANVTQGTLSKTQYWNFDVGRSIRFKYFEEYVEGFRYYFEQAVRRRLRSIYPIAVSVSGGLDSSSIFCLAETIKKRGPQPYPEVLGFSCIFENGTPQDEKSYLLDIEHDYSVSIRRIPMGLQGIMEGSRESLWHVEAPYLDNLQNLTKPLYKSIQESGIRIVLSGTMGDQMLFDQEYLVDLFNHLSWYKVWTHLREFGKWNLDVDPKWFMRFFFRRLIRSYVPDKFVPYFGSIKRKLIKSHLNFGGYKQIFHKMVYRHISNNDLIKTHSSTAHSNSLFNQIKSRYNIFCLEWNNKLASIYGIEFSYPFLDRDLVSYLMAIPGEVQTWKGVPKGILRESLRGVLPMQVLQRRSKADFTDLINEQMVRDFHSIVENLQLGRMAVSLGYVDEKILGHELTRLKGQIRRPDCLVSWSLYDLLGLEIWLQVFFGKTIEGKEVYVT